MQHNNIFAGDDAKRIIKRQQQRRQRNLAVALALLAVKVAAFATLKQVDRAVEARRERRRLLRISTPRLGR